MSIVPSLSKMWNKVMNFLSSHIFVGIHTLLITNNKYALPRNRGNKRKTILP